MAYDFDIYKGTTFSLSLTLKDSNGTPINLSGYNVSGFLKYRPSDTDKLCDLNPIKTNPASGIVTLTISYNTTATLPCGHGFYDIQIHNTGTDIVTRVLDGKANIYPEFTY
jgi:hypothetical protein